jgi:WD40 repeat protein
LPTYRIGKVRSARHRVGTQEALPGLPTFLKNRRRKQGKLCGFAAPGFLLLVRHEQRSYHEVVTPSSSDGPTMHTRPSAARWLIPSLAALAALVLALPSAAHAQARRNRTTPGLVLETGARHATCDVLLFADGGRTLLATGDDKVVRSWDVVQVLANSNGLHRSHNLRWPILRERRGCIFAMALSPDQKQVVVGGLGIMNGAMVVLDRASGAIVHALGVQPTQRPVWTAAWAPSAFGRKVLYGTDEGEVVLWNLDTGKASVLPRSRVNSLNKVWLIAFPDPAKAEFITVAQDGAVWQRSLSRPDASPKRIAQFKLPDLRCVAISAGGRWLAACGENRTGSRVDVKRVELIDLHDGTRKFIDMPQRDTKRTVDFPQCLAFDDSRTAPRLAVGVRQISLKNQTKDRTLFTVIGGLVDVFDVSSGQRVLSQPFDVGYQPDAVAFRPGGRQVATAGGNDHEVRLWAVHNPARPLATIRGPGSCMWGVAFGYVRDARTGREKERYLGFQDKRNADPGNPNNWGDPASWRVFDLDARRLLPNRPREFRPYRALAEADGWTLQTTRNSYVWEVVDPDGKTTPLTQEKGLWNANLNNLPRCYTFIPRGGRRPTQLVVGHTYGASVYELEDGKVRLTRRLLGHEADVMAVAPSKSGKLLLTAGRDMTLACWSLVPWPSQPELGASFAVRNGTLRVKEVDAGSPAWELGLLPHDEIVLISAYADKWYFDPEGRFRGDQARGVRAELKDPRTGDPQPVSTRKGASKVSSASAAIQRLKKAGSGRPLIFLWKRNGKLAGLQLTTMPQRPLWRFFATRKDQGNDWVIWRWLDYFYDTRSVNADRFLGWHVNAGSPFGTPTFHPLERFRGTDAVQQARTGEVGFHQPQKVWSTILRTVNNPSQVPFAEIEPPDVKVAVANPGRKPGDGVTLSVTITPRSANPKQRLEKVLLWRDDYRYDDKARELQPKGGGAISVPKLVIPAARLRNGENVITVQCYNAWGGRGEASVQVNFFDPNRPRATLYALCIGLCKYKKAKGANPGEEFPDLAWAVADARAIDALLRAQGKTSQLYGSVKPELLDDTAGPVTAATIKAKLARIRAAATPDDTIVLFLAGHGDADGKFTPGSFYFVCSDTDGRKAQTKLTSKDLHELLSTTQGRKVLFLDACRSGALVRSHPLRDLNRDGARLLIFSACKPDESALEPLPRFGKNGLFTQCLVDAIRKAKKREVTAPDIRDSLLAGLPVLLKGLQQEPNAQNPVFLFPERDLSRALLIKP